MPEPYSVQSEFCKAAGNGEGVFESHAIRPCIDARIPELPVDVDETGCLLPGWLAYLARYLRDWARCLGLWQGREVSHVAGAAREHG
ncbi:MAG TPA: hypothetical protein VLT36_12300 [Candidatus Dormibacteraeota bacterium]|nr:hypothetical protein [Candidatus Dormibacteraeota bacterium]